MKRHVAVDFMNVEMDNCVMKFDGSIGAFAIGKKLWSFDRRTAQPCQEYHRHFTNFASSQAFPAAWRNIQTFTRFLSLNLFSKEGKT